MARLSALNLHDFIAWKVQTVTGSALQTSSAIGPAIAAFACDHARPIPDSARAVTRLSLLDWAAVALAGLGEPVSRIVRDLVTAEAGAEQATGFGLCQRVPARAAALANGTLSHALDYDDTHFSYVGHPSVAVFPAALAVAELTGSGGDAFLEAALIGMEAACRIGAWLGTAHYQHGFHQTATSGTFGATVAAARLLRLDVDQMCHALGIAATRASGLKSQFGTMGKPYNAGIAASNGVEAAMLARAGFISRPDGLDCEQGFAATHFGESRDLSGILAGLGDVFWFEDVQHKFHACCHGLHAMIEALAILRDMPGYSRGGVDKVVVRTNPRWLRVCNIASPMSGLEAKFSYRLVAAMVLAGWPTGGLSTFSDDACHDPILIPLRDRILVESDPQVSDTAAVVEITFRDGQMIEARFDLDTRLPLAAREAKIHAKLYALLGRARADAVTEAVHLLSVGSARDFADRIKALSLSRTMNLE